MLSVKKAKSECKSEPDAYLITAIQIEDGLRLKISFVISRSKLK
jgi:hypothetical protein